MQLDALITQLRQPVLDDAVRHLTHADTPHYRNAGTDEVRNWLGELYDVVQRAIVARSLADVDNYAAALAQRRFAAGFSLGEVQLAFNATEHALWVATVSSVLPRHDLVVALGLESSAFGSVKDAVAREYLGLAAHRHTPAVDIPAVASGAFA